MGDPSVATVLRGATLVDGAIADVHIVAGVIERVDSPSPPFARSGTPGTHSTHTTSTSPDTCW